MDITAIRNDPNPEGHIFQEILPHTDTKSTTNEESDALSAVKLDPAVLEARITINKTEKNEPIPASTTITTKDAESERPLRFDFDRAMCMQRAALMSLSGQQLHLLMKYIDTLRLQRQSTQKLLECVFCKSTGHSEIWYTTHAVKDGNGRVRCPMLRACSCRRCGATGDHAHTIKYCPHKG